MKFYSKIYTENGTNEVIAPLKKNIKNNTFLPPSIQITNSVFNNNIKTMEVSYENNNNYKFPFVDFRNICDCLNNVKRECKIRIKQQQQQQQNHTNKCVVNQATRWQ